MALLVLLLPPAIYLQGYVLWGRDVVNAAGNDGFYFWQRADASFQDRLKLKAEKVAYFLWKPLREWERARLSWRVAKTFSGEWALEDGRTATVLVQGEQSGYVHVLIRSADFPWAETDAILLCGSGDSPDEVLGIGGDGFCASEPMRSLSLDAEGRLTISSWSWKRDKKPDLGDPGIEPVAAFGFRKVTE